MIIEFKEWKEDWSYLKKYSSYDFFKENTFQVKFEEKRLPSVADYVYIDQKAYGAQINWKVKSCFLNYKMLLS